MTTTPTNREPKIGEGIFFPNEVAEILQLPYSNVRYWMNGFWCNHTFGTKRNHAVNFYTLIEFYTYYHLRKQKISAHEIKQFHTWLSKEFNTEYPFASIKLATHGKEIFYYFGEFLLRANKKKQPTIKPFIEPFIKNIDFGTDSIAMRYFPLGMEKKVVVDPKYQFGKPIIISKSVRTEVIYKFHLGGEKNENICNLYDLTSEEVEDAIIFHTKAA